MKKHFRLIFTNGSLGAYGIDAEQAMDEYMPIAERIEKLGKFLRIEQDSE